MLQAVGIHKTFPGGVVALRAVSLEVARGETVALIGESGCGKSTLLRMFNRLVEPDSGKVLVGDRPVEGLDAVELRRATGYVQQEGGLLPHWSVGRNVELVPELLGWDASRRRARSDQLLELVGLSPARYRERYPRAPVPGSRTTAEEDDAARDA
jgi:osmoprotectant transport system ATP-binding protein